MKRLIYSVYKKIEANTLAATACHFLYRKFFCGYKPQKYEPSKIQFIKKEYKSETELDNLKLAVISDEMTFVNLKTICNAVFLTPDRWLDIMLEEKPDVFFCESAWSGIELYKDCWRGSIYKNKKLLFENRGTLLDILDYCRRSGIKTVFWNKEDPGYFDDELHNFSETAVQFDYIFTTAEECVDRYKKLGHSRVFVMGFGFSPDIFNCPADFEKENKAVFAGSWYSDHPQRCKDMERAFDMLIKKGIPLEIYDRNWDSPNPVHRFPDRFRPYLHEAVDYEALGEIYKKCRFAVNINTENKSETMYARRVNELMACRCVVVSNESAAMRKKFGKNVWFIGEDFDFDNEKAVCDDNYNYVMKNCTNLAEFERMLLRIGIELDNQNN